MELFTFEALSTLAGASLLVYLIVQYTKNIVPTSIPTDIYAVFVGAVVLFVAQVAEGAAINDWRLYLLSFFNGFLVALTAGKMNDTALRPPRSKGQYEGEA